MLRGRRDVIVIARRDSGHRHISVGIRRALVRDGVVRLADQSYGSAGDVLTQVVLHVERRAAGYGARRVDFIVREVETVELAPVMVKGTVTVCAVSVAGGLAMIRNIAD